MRLPEDEQESDAVLVARFRRGEGEAFDRIVERYRKDVYRISYRMTGSHEDADDVAQETFLRAYRALAGFRGESALRTWLFRIALNLSINVGRARSSHPWLRSDVEEPERAGESAADGERRLLVSEQARLVRTAVRALPPKQRQVLILRMYEDLQFNEIAALLECPIGTAKANFFHAINNLRRALA